MKLKPSQEETARRIYADCLKKGYPPAYAKRLVTLAVSRHVSRSGMGEELPPSAFEPALAPQKGVLAKVADHQAVAAVRAAVSPWLWVTSLVSFGMALINRRQIALMFGKWKRRNQGKG